MALSELSAHAPLDFEPSGHLYATHHLHAYAARCPPPLVDWAVSRYTESDEVVLDPMVGSGTTLVEAALLGRRARGADIDPLARLIAKVKATPVEPGSIATAGIELRELLEGDALDRTWRPELPDLEKWFRPDVCEDLARLRHGIVLAGESDPDLADLLWVTFSSIIVARTSVANARDLVHSRHHYREWTENPDAPARFLTRLKRVERAMSDYIQRLGGRHVDARIVGTDARSLDLPAGSVDCVFMSPPYVSALDYVRAHFFAVAWMSDVLGSEPEDYRTHGRRYVGTERAALRDGGREAEPPSTGVPAVDQVVGELHAEHPRNAWVVWRYFNDMTLILHEIARVLRPERHAILVVCPSNIRKVRVPTHDLFVDLVTGPAPAVRGLECVEMLERTIHDRRRVMPYLESAFGPRMRTEYVIVFRRSQD